MEKTVETSEKAAASNEKSCVNNADSEKLIDPQLKIDSNSSTITDLQIKGDCINDDNVNTKKSNVTTQSNEVKQNVEDAEIADGASDLNADLNDDILIDTQLQISDDDTDENSSDKNQTESLDSIKQESDFTEVSSIESIIETDGAVEQIIVEDESHSLQEQVVFTSDDNSAEESISYIEVSNANEISDDFLVVNNSEEVISVNGITEIVQQEVVDDAETTEIILNEVHGINTGNIMNEDENEIVILQKPDSVESVHESSINVTSNLNMDALKTEEKIKQVQIPCHVLGRNIENPLEDPVRNGRVLLKPRLGVKIPCRNLTSQIVSKQDITNEIMERSRMRQSVSDLPAGGDVFFARKLTHRLAKKITAPTKTNAASASSSSKNSSTVKPTTSMVDIRHKPDLPSRLPDIPDTAKKITDNSDLIALLEGDDDTDWLAIDPKANKSQLQKHSAEWERETALKQLRELPKHTKPVQIIKEAPKFAIKPEAPESNSDDINTEPRFSSSLVTKTYTRKRKPSEDIKRSMSPTILQTSRKDVPVPPITPNKTNSSASVIASPISKSPSLNVVKSSIKSSISSLKTSTPKPTTSNVQKSIQKQPSSTPLQKTISQTNLQKVIDKKQITVKVEKKLLTPIISEKPPEFKALSPNTYISKSSRIIKRKKIWDPDEATPAFKSSPTKPAKILSAPEKSTEKKVPNLKPVKEKQESLIKSTKPVLKPSNEKLPTKKPMLKTMMKKKKQKRLTEIDRLLMDEGAVNLLYAVKNTDELQGLGKKKNKSVISLDKMQKELLNKTNEIKNDLQMNSTKDLPISLRKKEAVTPKASSPTKDVAAAILQRKKSRDSTAGSVHSPPASPGFTYSQHAEASRIIRRHSSSSFSSENADAEESGMKYSKNKSVSDHKSEPQRKRFKATDKHVLSEHKSSFTIDKQHLKEEMIKSFNKLKSEDEYAEFATFSVRKFEHLIQIILTPSSRNGQITLSLKVLTELILIFDLLEKDKKCRVVLISSSGNSFCQGIDYKELVLSKTQNQNIIEHYADCVREFLTTLSKFSKVLIAGVHGHVVGLGVTMLPLFDMVLANDSATFSTPYTQLGCAVEGGMLLTHSRSLHNALASELFFASRKLTASEALHLGLVTRTIWADKFQEELMSTVNIVSHQSLQSMLTIKKQLRSNFTNVDSLLKSESAIWIEHWSSNECQSNFSSYSLESK